MNMQDAVEALNTCQSAPLYAEIVEIEGFISGGNNPEWVDYFEHVGIPGWYSVEETFALKPVKQNTNLWYGSACRYGNECYFSPKTLEELVKDIIDFYAGSSEIALDSEFALNIMIRLSQQGFFVRHEQGVILGTMRMNFAFHDFWLGCFGNFYVASDSNMRRGIINDPVIICSRSIDTVIECLTVYYGEKDSSQP